MTAAETQEGGSSLVKWIEQIMVGFGAGWVMWLMLGLSVISVAVMLERAWFYYTLRDDLTTLARDLRNALESSVEAARKRMSASPSAEAAVVMAGLSVYEKGHASAEEAMDGAKALQRMKLEKRLVYLATIGNNAPFIGLFGTVIGVIGAFKALGEQTAMTVEEVAKQALAPKDVMIAISEALVATAVGIAIAIPAVAANNYFQRSSKRTLANTEALTKVLLSHMKAVPAGSPEHHGDVDADAGPSGEGKRAGKKGKRSARSED